MIRGRFDLGSILFGADLTCYHFNRMWPLALSSTHHNLVHWTTQEVCLKGCTEILKLWQNGTGSNHLNLLNRKPVFQKVYEMWFIVIVFLMSLWSSDHAFLNHIISPYSSMKQQDLSCHVRLLSSGNAELVWGKLEVVVSVTCLN